MSKPLWVLLMIITGALALWRGVTGGVALWEYTRLSTAVPAHVEKIEVVSMGSKYALEVVYSYGFQEKTYTKKTLLRGPYHLNRSSAEKTANQIKGMQWLAYVDPTHPGRSALENVFPLREVLYGACLIGIFVYFLYLRIHLELLSRVQ